MLGVCAYCGLPADTIDHVIPQAFGGPNTEENRVPACQSCNSSKGTLPQDVWRLNERERTAWLKERGWTRLGSNSFTSPDTDDRVFYTKAAALRHEGFVRSGVTADASRTPSPRKRPAPLNGLIGRWFHSYVPIPEGQDRRHLTVVGDLMLEWQGQVVDRDGDLLIAQLYSWWDGMPGNEVVVNVGDIRNWKFFPTNEAMRLARGCEEHTRSEDRPCCAPITHVIRDWHGMGSIYRCSEHIQHYVGKIEELK